MCSYLWYSFVTAVISNVVVCSPLKTDKSANSVEELHIEIIKKKILEQLHFTTRPPKEIRRGKIVVPRPALDDDKNDDKRDENKVEILLPSESSELFFLYFYNNEYHRLKVCFRINSGIFAF